MLSDRFYLFEM